MSIKTALAAHTKTQGMKCAIGLIRTTLPAKDRKELDEVLTGPATSAALARAMTAEYERRVADEAVRKHRNGVCSCGAR